MPALLMGPLGKLLGVLALVLAIFLSGEWHGRAAIQQAWDASTAEQALKAAAAVIDQAEHTAKIHTRYIKIKGDTKIVTQIVEKEIVKYVQDPTAEHCLLSPQFERGFNAISGVLDRPADRLPAPSGPTGDPVEHAGAPLTDVAILYAHHDTVSQLRDLWDAYRTLVTWVRESYNLQRAGTGRPPVITE